MSWGEAAEAAGEVGPTEVTAASLESEACAGLALGLKQMKRGSKWELKIAPSQGFGADGAPAAGDRPAVPPDSSLCAEIELLDFEKLTDASPGQDGSVLLKEIEKGEGWKHPSQGDLAYVRYTLKSADDVSLKGEGNDRGEQPDGVVHTLGSGTLPTGLEFALMKMNKGGKAEVTIAAGEHAKLEETNPDAKGLKATAELVSWRSVEELVEGVTMLEITEGEEYKTPKELSKCTFHLVAISLSVARCGLPFNFFSSPVT